MPPPGAFPAQPAPGPASRPGFAPVPAPPGYQTGPQPGLPIHQTGPQPGLPIGAAFTPPARPAVPVLTLVALATLLLSGVLAVVGSFFTLDTFSTHSTNAGAGDISTSTNTAWSVQNSGDPTTQAQWLGIPLVVGGALVLVAAVLLIMALSKPLAWARPVAAAAGALLFGAALTVVMSVLGDLGFGSSTPDSVTTVSPGLGFWLVLGGGVLAIAATVCTLPIGRTSAPTHPR